MKLAIFTLIMFLFVSAISSQDLPIQTVTLFQNNRALLLKAGEITSVNGKYSTQKLPEALFGTYWVSSPSDKLESVFVVLDSTEEVQELPVSIAELLRENIGKQVQLKLGSEKPETIEGVIDQVIELNTSDEVILNTGNAWISINLNRINGCEFPEKPRLKTLTKEPAPRLDINFVNKAQKQDIGLSYLRENMGWIPVYRLELLDKDNGKLTLRGDLINNAETIEASTIKLAATTPNFAKASEASELLDIEGWEEDEDLLDIERYSYAKRKSSAKLRMGRNLMLMSAHAQYASADDVPNEMGMSKIFSRMDADFGDDQDSRFRFSAEGAQSEDFYFYTLNIGKFPRNSRYQYPIFEAPVQVEHYYEAWIEPANSYAKRRSEIKDDYPVSHYVEFENKTQFPWTSGTVSILAKPINKPVAGKESETDKILAKHGGDLQPISQTILAYTSSNENCKVLLSRSPDIKVTHAESDTDREINVKKVTKQEYDKVKIEAQLGIVNNSDETINIRLFRKIEGNPGKCSVSWKTTENQVSLALNDSYLIEWNLELKPKENKTLMYSYSFLVKGKTEKE